MLSKSKMDGDSIRKKIKEQVGLLNTFLNMVDPAKDAKVAFPRPQVIAGVANKAELEEGIHGPFLVSLYQRLFNGNMLSQGDSARLKGTGNGLGKVLRAIETILQANLDTFSYDYSSLGYSSEGDSAWRMHEMNFIIDTAIGLDRIGDTTCKAVVGPFSILDKAPRTMNYPKSRMIDLLAHSSTLPESFLARIGMDKALDSISYEKEAASYKFTFALKPFLVYEELPQQKVIRYDASFKTADGFVNQSTNSVRNAFIYDNYANLNSMIIKKILFLILFKELGDTLQATWILQYIKDEVLETLRMENTAIVSVDRGVLYRSVINGVGCLYTNNGAQCSSFYPRIGRPFKVKHGPLAGKTVDSEFMRKRSLFQSLIANNNSVVALLKGIIASFELAKGRIRRGEEARISIYDWSDSFETMGLDVPVRKEREAIVVNVMLILLKSMMNYILPIVEHIESEMDRLAKSTEENAGDYEKKVVNYKVSYPFNYNTNEGVELKVRWYKSFRQFLKEPVVGLAKDGTNKFDLYNLSLLYKKAVPTQEQLETIVFSDETPVAQRIVLVPIDWKEGAPAAVAPVAVASLSGQRRRRDEEEDDAEEEAGRNDKSLRQQGGETTATAEALFSQNNGSPNFLLFFLLTYSPEFFALACAYELSARNDSRVLEKYRDVFSTAKTTSLCAGYGALDEHYLYEYSATKTSGSSQRTSSLNSLCTHACAVLKAVFEHRTKEPTPLLTLAKEKSPEIEWLIEHLDDYFALPSVSLDMDHKMFHWDAACYYQQIFDADVNLCVLNERSRENPLDAVSIFRKRESLAKSANRRTRRVARNTIRKIKSPLRRTLKVNA